MYCYQCEQTAKGTGCTVAGVCGKTDEIAALQDLLITVAKGLSSYGHLAWKLGVRDAELNKYVIEALFTTVTNVNFDPERLRELILRAMPLRDKILSAYHQAAKEANVQAQHCECDDKSLPEDLAGLIELGRQFAIDKRKETLGEDIAGLQELITYGLKGTAAYVHHAEILSVEDEDIYGFFLEAMSFLDDDPVDVDALTTMALRVGEVNLKAMEILDRANTTAYGHPEPTQVRVTPVAGKCILISGHDLKDLDELLKQTEGQGINVYTHGEMLPCCAYPGLKKYKHLVGNYGGAWQDQKKEFDAFPGAILMTTNCIQKPADSYMGRIFTCGLVAWPGVTHISDRNFAPVIDAAKSAPGFDADAEEKSITIGFAHNAVLGVAGTVVDAVKAGKLKHFFLIGGCDGAKSGRNYYTELAQAVPQDCVIITLACGKYRFNKLDFGDIGGIPRLLDMGQCNDAYSAIKVAVALAEAVGCGVNELPLSMVLSWYEQKAVCILLTLLHLGIQGIKIGPTLPAFITPPVLNVLVEKFNIAPVTTPDEDLKEMLEK